MKTNDKLTVHYLGKIEEAIKDLKENPAHDLAVLLRDINRERASDIVDHREKLGLPCSQEYSDLDYLDPCFECDIKYHGFKKDSGEEMSNELKRAFLERLINQEKGLKNDEKTDLLIEAKELAQEEFDNISREFDESIYSDEELKEEVTCSDGERCSLRDCIEYEKSLALGKKDIGYSASYGLNTDGIDLDKSPHISFETEYGTTYKFTGEILSST